MSKISLVLINFNGTKFLPTCIKSVLNQQFIDFDFTIIDNVSTDQSVSLIRNNYGQNPKVKLIQNIENNGYAGAANQAVQIAINNRSEYLMILNPDIVLEPSYLQKALKLLDQRPKIAGYTGKILNYTYGRPATPTSPATPSGPTNTIDSVGLKCGRNRRIVDFGQGQTDTGQFDQSGEVFGVSGSCPIYRLSALQDIAMPNSQLLEIFDPAFFMYKEDIDVSWRLRLRGWQIHYDAQNLSYHGRGTDQLKEFSHWQVYKNRQNASQIAKYHAFKNQRLMMIKNEQWSNFLRDLPFIFFKEILVTGYIILRDPRLIKAILHLLRQTPAALKKRRHIQKNATTPANQIRPFLTSKL